MVVVPTSGLRTSEAGTVASITFRLATAPSENVYFTLSSNATDEATISPSVLSFTQFNWNAWQTVLVTGVDDALIDGNQDFAVVTGVAISADPDYSDLEIDDVSGTNLDDETPGIVVTAGSSLTTTEDGTTSTFTIALQTAPASDVSIPVASSDPTEALTSPVSVSFTPVNWDVPQVITVTGVDDELLDGTQAYVVRIGPTTSSELAYDGLTASDVPLTNEDNDSPRIVVTPSEGLLTTEAGGTASVAVTLGAEPTGDVTVSGSSSNVLEGTVSPSARTFTSSNWSVPQLFTVSGVDDIVIDGDQTYEVVLHVSASADARYLTATDRRVSATNSDNETAGVTLSPTMGLTTSESGTSTAFDVVLNAPPVADVSITLSSSNASEGTVNPASLTFTAANWSVAQSVDVTGVDDDVADGTRAYTIVTSATASADSRYAGLIVADVGVANLDDDSAGVTVSPLAGLVTTEAGATAAFSVVLNAAPTDDVSISFASSDVSEGVAAPSTLTFSNANWSTPQLVTISGVNDFTVDGDVAYSIVSSATSSASALYNGLPVSDVAAINQDNDVAGVTVTPVSGLVTTEAGGTASFTLVLGSQPTADVSISLATSDASEGTASPASVTFTSVNWSTPRTVVVSGVNDSLDDGDVVYSIVTSATTSSDSVYAGLAVADVSVTNTDNDAVGVVVSPTAGLTTTEIGGTAIFTVVLASQPAADVTFGISSSNLAAGTVAPSSLTFTSANWNVPQSVTATGLPDHVLVGNNVPYTITTAPVSSADPLYNGINPSDVSVTNIVAVAQQAYVKASNTDASDNFGVSIALSADGNTLAVGALCESSSSTGVDGPSTDNATMCSGAVYIYVRVGTTWTQQAYLKASNTGAFDYFGGSVALSANGDTLAVGAWAESSNGTGINGNQLNNSIGFAGAMFVFTRTGSTWSQEVYIKPSAMLTAYRFGQRCAVSADGNTLAVGAIGESSNAIGVGGNPNNTAVLSSGAAYIFSRSGSTWTQQSYIKASNSRNSASFGQSVALSSDGDTLAVGASYESSAATGINGNQASTSATGSGAAYVFTRAAAVWTQQAYVKASNTGNFDSFGTDIALSGNGDTLAVGAVSEASNATGIDGNQADNSQPNAGAVYVFSRSGTTWSQQAYVKSSSSFTFYYFSLPALDTSGDILAVSSPGEETAPDGPGVARLYRRVAGTWSYQRTLRSNVRHVGDRFGASLAMSRDGSTLAVGAPQESSNAVGINGDASNTTSTRSGAAYVLTDQL